MQDFDDLVTGHKGARQKIGLQANAHTPRAGLQQGQSVVRRQASAHREGLQFALYLVRPVAGAGRHGIHQAFVVLQGAGVLRLAVESQVGGRGRGHQPARAELAHDVTRLQVGRDAHGQINALFNEVGALVGKIQQQFHMRVRVGKVQ